MTLILTQPQPRAQRLAAWLHVRAVSVACWPLTALHVLPDVDWQSLQHRLARCTWVILPSPTVIEMVLSTWHQKGWTWPTHVGVALIGTGSDEALAPWRACVPGLASAPLYVPPGPVFDADALVTHLIATGVSGQCVAVLCRVDARVVWAQRLQQAGAVVALEPVYCAQPLAPPAMATQAVVQWVHEQRRLAFSVASVTAGLVLSDWLAGGAQAVWLRQQAVLTQHPRIAQILLQQGWRHVRCHEPGRAALWQAWSTWASEGDA